MITILKNEKNDIIYACDCGIQGKCMVKPQEGNAVIVVDVRCPICLEEGKRVVLSQSDGNNDPENLEFSWSPIISNDIIDYTIKEEDEE